MSVTISQAHRDAVYGQILDRLSGLDDVRPADSIETANRIGHQHSDELRLILEDLRWGDEDEAEAVELTTPPDVLLRVFRRLRDAPIGDGVRHRAGRTDSHEREVRDRLVGEACQVVLATLDEDECR